MSAGLPDCKSVLNLMSKPLLGFGAVIRLIVMPGLAASKLLTSARSQGFSLGSMRISQVIVIVACECVARGAASAEGASRSEVKVTDPTMARTRRRSEDVTVCFIIGLSMKTSITVIALPWLPERPPWVTRRRRGRPVGRRRDQAAVLADLHLLHNSSTLLHLFVKEMPITNTHPAMRRPTGRRRDIYPLTPLTTMPWMK